MTQHEEPSHWVSSTEESSHWVSSNEEPSHWVSSNEFHRWGSSSEGPQHMFFMDTLEKERKSQINYQKLPLFRALVLFISVTKLSVSRIYAFRSDKMPTSFVRSEWTKPKMNTI